MTPEQLLDSILAKHKSEITGAMVQRLWRELGIPPHIFLSIIGAETGMGDPEKGGRLVGVHNYGCMKASSTITAWGRLSNGTIEVGGKKWFTFPDVETGVRALGLLLKYGPPKDPGYYMRCFRRNRGWYEDFAVVYYGKDKNIPGLDHYICNLIAIDAKLCRIAEEAGYRW